MLKGAGRAGRVRRGESAIGALAESSSQPSWTEPVGALSDVMIGGKTRHERLIVRGVLEGGDAMIPAGDRIFRLWCSPPLLILRLERKTEAQCHALDCVRCPAELFRSFFQRD